MFIGEKKKIDGTVSSADNERFTIINSRTGETVPIAYTEVKQVRKKGLHPAAKVGIGVGIGFAVLATAAAIALRDD